MRANSRWFLPTARPISRSLRELHTSFTLTPGSGGVALSRLYNGQPQVLDYVNYNALPPDRTYGSFPDGQSFFRAAVLLPITGPNQQQHQRAAHGLHQRMDGGQLGVTGGSGG